MQEPAREDDKDLNLGPMTLGLTRGLGGGVDGAQGAIDDTKGSLGKASDRVDDVSDEAGKGRKHAKGTKRRRGPATMRLRWREESWEREPKERPRRQ